MRLSNLADENSRASHGNHNTKTIGGEESKSRAARKVRELREQAGEAKVEKEKDGKARTWQKKRKEKS